MTISIDTDHVLLGQKFASKWEVIAAIGDVMLASGDATPRYAEAMFEKEKQFNTCITEDVAFPHGTNEAKDEVLRSSVVVVQLPDGIDWGDQKAVHLAIGVAGKGDDQHVRLLTAVARILQDKHLVQRLKTTRDGTEVVRILQGDGLQ